MTYRGHVENGVVVFDGNVAPPDGTVVSVEPVSAPLPNGSSESESLIERLKDVVGRIDDLPADFAQQHDHYIHGTPRR